MVLFNVQSTSSSTAVMFVCKCLQHRKYNNRTYWLMGVALSGCGYNEQSWLLVGVVIMNNHAVQWNQRELFPQQYWTFPHTYESKGGPCFFRLQCPSGWEVKEYLSEHGGNLHSEQEHKAAMFSTTVTVSIILQFTKHMNSHISTVKIL